MMNRCITFLASATITLAFATSALHGQALPAASKGGIIQVGGGITSGTTDIFTKRTTGFTGYGSFDFTGRFGVEADVHIMAITTPDDLTLNSYLIGPRYVYRKGRYEPYGKIMFGIGTTAIDSSRNGSYFIPNTPGSFGMYAVGGGLDIRFSHHLNVRAIDFDYQKWPGFKPNGLTPSNITIGAAYRLR